MTMIVMQAEQWRRIVTALFMAAGATCSNAERVAEALVDANLAGHDSHGVTRVPQYIQAIAEGKLNPSIEPVVLKETACSVLIDGRWTFGQVAAQMCMREAIRRAGDHGVAVAALIRSYHIGRLGEYSEMAHDAGMIAFLTSGGFGGQGIGGGVAPFGGAKPALQTNPLSFGIPAGAQPPVLIDFATSAVALGKVNLARIEGRQLPHGCILDSEGIPSTNPNDYYNGGTLLPFGGYKGYGLSVAAELLGQALTGADTCENAMGRGGVYMRSGTFFVIIDSGLFRPRQEYGKAADAIIQRIKAVPPAPGFSEVLLPGGPEQRSKARRLQEGIGLAKSSWETIRGFGVKYGLNVDELMGSQTRSAS